MESHRSTMIKEDCLESHHSTMIKEDWHEHKTFRNIYKALAVFVFVFLYSPDD